MLSFDNPAAEKAWRHAYAIGQARGDVLWSGFSCPIWVVCLVRGVLARAPRAVLGYSALLTLTTLLPPVALHWQREAYLQHREALTAVLRLLRMLGAVLLQPYATGATPPTNWLGLFWQLGSTSRTFMLVMLALGMRLRLVWHLPIQLLSLAIALPGNSAACATSYSAGSPIEDQMEAAVAAASRTANWLGGLVAVAPASSLLGLNPANGCQLLHALLQVHAGGVLPTLLLWFMESRSRADYAARHGVQRSEADVRQPPVLALLLLLAPVHLLLWRMLELYDLWLSSGSRTSTIS